MYQVLFKLGAFEVRSYGLMLALSFVFGIWLASYRAKKWKVDTGIVLDMSLIIIISSILGARLMYVLFHLDEFSGRWLDTINPFQSTGEVGISGMTMIGGLLFSVVFGLTFLWIKKQPVLKITDIMAPSVAVGIFLTRIGCFLNGCCFGKPCSNTFGVVFPGNSPAGFIFPDQAVIPAQLYSALYGLVILVLLLTLEKRYRKYDGFTFFLLFFLYGLSRFIIDFFRFYETSMVLAKTDVVSFSVNQGVSFILALFFGALIIYKNYKQNQERKNS